MHAGDDGCAAPGRSRRRCRRPGSATSGVDGDVLRSSTDRRLGQRRSGVGLGGLDLRGFLVPFGIWIVRRRSTVAERRCGSPRPARAARSGAESCRRSPPPSSRPTAKTSRTRRAEHQPPPDPVDARRQRPAGGAAGRRHAARITLDSGPAALGVATPGRPTHRLAAMTSPSRPRRPARRVLALVRRPRARPALARRGGDAVVGDGLGVHAAADAGRPGAAGARAVARALADARRPGRRAEPARRCGPGAGSATRAGRCACTPPPPRSSSGTAARCPRRTTTCARCPGVGDYTAAAIATFGFGRRHAVLDTNVRRVLARLVTGVEFPPVAATARRARPRRRACCPTTTPTAATWSVALMELGALVCTAAKPRCGACPVADRCAWRAAGYPAYDGPPRKAQTWAGTDRQCRGRLLARGARRRGRGRTQARLDVAWDDAAQRARCLAVPARGRAARRDPRRLRPSRIVLTLRPSDARWPIVTDYRNQRRNRP